MARLAGPQPLSLLMHATVIGGTLALARWPAFQEAWARLPSYDPWTILPTGVWFLSIVTTWTSIGLFWLLDHHKRPAWLYRTKIQEDRPRPSQPSDGEAARLGLFNGLVMLPLQLAGLFALLLARGWTLDPALPPWTEVLWHLGFLLVWSDVAFHFGHWALHSRWWMKHVHSVHHRFTAPTGLASMYQHPAEYVLTGVGPLALGVVVLMPHALTIALFTVVGALNVVVTHSGYNLPFATWAGFHDLHHARVRGNYGVTGVLDWLFRTWLPLETRDPRP